MGTMHINMYRLCWVLSIKFNIIQYVAISMGTCLVFLIICVCMYMYIQLYIYIYVLFGRGSEIHEGLSLVMKYRSIVLLRLVLGNLSNLNRYQSNNGNQYYGVYSTLVKVIHIVIVPPTIDVSTINPIRPIYKPT